MYVAADISANLSLNPGFKDLIVLPVQALNSVFIISNDLAKLSKFNHFENSLVDFFPKGATQGISTSALAGGLCEGDAIRKPRN